MKIKAYGQTDDERIVAEMFKEEIKRAIIKDHENTILASDLIEQIQREADR